MPTGPDFSKNTKDVLAKRAGQKCSNPDCRKPTSGPHSDKNKALNLGEAAHIRAAREGQARHDPSMADEERRDIANGIWLCRECARKIDLDEEKYPPELLIKWKEEHEKGVMKSRDEEIAREIKVKDGGIGSVVVNEGEGIGLDIEHHGNGPAERIQVEGSGIGEIISSTGRGTGKRIVSTGGGSASESHVIVNRPVRMAIGMSATTVATSCKDCGRTFQFSKVIQGFAGDKEPKVEVKCPQCGSSQWI